MTDMEVHGFRRSVTGRISVRLDHVERGLLRSLAEQVIELVEPDVSDVDPLEAIVGINPQAAPPQDPALARLLPAGYRDDDEAAAEFRRFTDQSLRAQKVYSARTVLADLSDDDERIKIAHDHVDPWLTFFTDVRLVIGTRIGISDELSAMELTELPDDDPRAGMAHIYDWLTFLQETLVRSVTT
jgi:hypothetical protein